MYCRSWRKKSCFWMPHGPTNEQMWCQSGQCSVTIAQFPQRPTTWPCSRNLTRSNSFTGPLLTSRVSSTSNAYTTIAVSSSHSVGIIRSAEQVGLIRRPEERLHGDLAHRLLPDET